MNILCRIRKRVIRQTNPLSQRCRASAAGSPNLSKDATPPDRSAGRKQTPNAVERPVRADDDSRDRLAIASLEHRCRRLTESLRESLGVDGCSGLLARAIADCEREHPALKGMRGPDDREVQLQGVAEAVALHGVPAVQSAVEALQVSLAGILGRLVGEDMAMRLMDLEGPASDEPGEEL